MLFSYHLTQSQSVISLETHRCEVLPYGVYIMAVNTIYITPTDDKFTKYNV